MLRPLPASRPPFTLLAAIAVHAAALAIVLLVPRRAAPPPAPSDDGHVMVRTAPAPPKPPGVGGHGRPPRGPKTGFHAPEPSVRSLTPEPAPEPILPLVAASSPAVAPSSAGPSDPGVAGNDGGGVDGHGLGPGEGTGREVGPTGEPGGSDEAPALQPDEPTILGADMTPPVLLHRVEPEYPPMARRAGAHGLVVLKCVIRADGSVEVQSVHRSVALLDDAAIAAVSQWRYEPARWNGRPQAVYQTVKVDFSLR